MNEYDDIAESLNIAGDRIRPAIKSRLSQMLYNEGLNHLREKTAFRTGRTRWAWRLYVEDDLPDTGDINVVNDMPWSEWYNDGHNLNPPGVAKRFVPGYWSGDNFVYDPSAKTGMMLKQRFIKGAKVVESFEKFIKTRWDKAAEKGLDDALSEVK